MGPSTPAGTRSNRDKAHERAASSAHEHGTPPAQQRTPRELALGAILACHGLPLKPNQTSQEMGCPTSSGWRLLRGLAPTMHHFLWHTWASQLLPASMDTLSGNNSELRKTSHQRPLRLSTRSLSMEIANKDTILTLRLLLGRFVLPRSNGNPRRTRNWTRRLVVAISATANSEGLGLTETAQEEQPERLRIYARILVDRHADGAETRSTWAFCGSVPNRRAKLLASFCGVLWTATSLVRKADFTCGKILPTWAHETVCFHTPLADHWVPHIARGSDESSSNLRVSLCDHLDGIGPTRPLRGMPALLKPSPPNFFARNPILQFAHRCPLTFSRV